MSRVAIYSQCTVIVESAQSQQKAEKPQKIAESTEMTGTCWNHVRQSPLYTACHAVCVRSRVSSCGKRQPMVAK